MKLFDRLTSKKKKTDFPEALANIFEKYNQQVAQQNAFFEQVNKEMGIDFSKTRVDGIANTNYGLVPENPIFTKGPQNTELYLSRLRTSAGEILNWKRLGSVETPNVSGRTDVYAGYLTNGSKYITIYLNWYGKSTSDSAPKGLSLS